MKVLQLVVLGIIAVTCTVSALFLYLLWRRKFTPTNVAPENIGLTLDLLALNITILDTVLVLVGFLVAIAGLYGYSGIKLAAIEAAKERAAEVAEYEAKKAADQQLTRYERLQGQKGTGVSEHPGGFSGGDISVEDASPAPRGE